MRHRRPTINAAMAWGLSACFALAAPAGARAQEPATPPPPDATPVAEASPPQPAKSTFEIYGFAMLDIGHDFKQIDPNWFDTMRVTKLPSSPNEFGQNNSTFASVRQSRFGVQSSTPTDYGTVNTKFEFEMFGTGVDEGQTTIRLRHAYGEFAQFLAGQTWSPFMDIGVFPNSLEYWGPTGMVFFRNIQLRYTPISDGKQTFMVAIERPGASGDAGIYADRVELQNVKPRFPLPDLSAAYKYDQKWGYVRAAGIVRRINWDDTLTTDNYALSGHATGWGINLTSNINAGKKDVVRLAYVFGEGIENYMNDSPVDVGIKKNLSNPVTPVVGDTLPVQGLLIFVDHTWNKEFTSAVGYSRQDIKNSDAMTPDSFKNGQYALGNVLYTPVPNVMVGGELQWGRRTNFTDGFHSDGFKVQFSFKYNFSVKLGG
jgi:nucleoside-specific outer membrane channel protein Tsx